MTTRENASVTVNIFDGARKPFPAQPPVLLTVIDGNRRTISREYHTKPTIRFDGLPTYNNGGDNYTVIAAADDYDQAGFVPVHVACGVAQIVDLMLVPKDAGFQFSKWEDLERNEPRIFKVLNAGAGGGQCGKDRYADSMEHHADALACLLNLTTAMEQIHLPKGTPLDYLREPIWDNTMACDRFFAWASKDLVNQVRMAAEQGLFAEEPNPGVFHKDATCSYKQIQFGEANVQLTFHENDVHQVDGEECIKVEPDIDYYRDLGAHAVLEVIPNTLTGGLTDPKKVYVLRWIAGRRAGLPEFAPPYVLA